MPRQARARGHLAGEWVTADALDGQVPSFRDALDGGGWWSVLEVPRITPVVPRLPTEAAGAVPDRSLRPGWRPRSDLAAPRSIEALAAGLAAGEWVTLTVAEGAQGPRTYQFAARRVHEWRDEILGREGWAVWRRNPDGSELKHARSNAPPDTPLPRLARVLSWR